MNREDAEALVNSRPWWYHKFEIYPGVVTPGVYDPSGTLSILGLPDDMQGMRVLEIGPADGYFTKMLSERGAHVVAVDYAAKDHCGFAVMEQLAGREYEFHHCNIFDLPKLGFEPFDLVLCLGVLYHLPDMCRALYILRNITSKRLIVETLISRQNEDTPAAEYLYAMSHNNDISNFWAPNPLCCEKMLNDAGFELADSRISETRGMFKADVVGPPRKFDIGYSSPDW